MQIEDIITSPAIVGIVFAMFIVCVGSIAAMCLIIYKGMEVIDDERP